MPELPEVEQFRQILLPLVSQQGLEILLVNQNPPRVWLSAEQVDTLNQSRVVCLDVVRKGKQLCMLLQPPKHVGVANTLYYLFLHMGMTGSIRSPGVMLSMGHEGPMGDNEAKEHKIEEEFPPKYSYLTMRVGEYRVAFSDPRKFGKCELATSLANFDTLAPDALLGLVNESDLNQILHRMVGQSTGIKALLLDQKRVVSGVGNWVADEVLYQTALHPDQSYLMPEQANQLLKKLKEILVLAVECLQEGRPYPSTWLFPYRWTKQKAGNDSLGRALTFLKSGGRTSAIVPSLQRLRKSQKPDNHNLVEEEEEEPSIAPGRFKVSLPCKDDTDRPNKRNRSPPPSKAESDHPRKRSKKNGKEKAKTPAPEKRVTPTKSKPQGRRSRLVTP